MKFMKLISLLLVCSIYMLLAATVNFGQDEMTTEKWREDIAYLRKELPKTHVNLYNTTPKSKFDAAFQSLHEQVPKLKNHEIIVELSRIAAMIGDGHSGIRIYSDPKIAFRSFPIRFYHYADGVFVRKIDRQLSQYAGARVIKVGNLPIEKAIKAVSPLISKDNEMWVKFYAPYFLASPEILHALKITNDLDLASFELEKDGKRHTVTLKPKGRLQLDGHAQTDKGMSGIDLVDARDKSNATPLWLKGDPKNSYWFEYLKDSKAIYFRYNEVQSKFNESIEKFADRLFKFIENNDVQKLIIDVRWNRGGSNELARPLILKLIKSGKIDQRGKLFLITGRRTFSAAQTFVNELERYTNVIIVGEPTASNVNHYGDNIKIILPNSGIKVRASYVRFEKMGPWESRKWTAPEITAELTSVDYRNGTDPALQAVLNFAIQPTVVEVMRDMIKKEGVPAAVKHYREFKKDKKNKYSNTEPLMTELATKLFVEDRKVPEALEILKLSVEDYPDEPNPYYILGQAYEFTNQLKLALQHYQKGYEIAENRGNFAITMRIKGRLDGVSARVQSSK